MQGMHVANLLRGDTASDISLETARTWLDECENTHVHCGTGRNVPLPKRLVDLAPIKSSHGLGVKLVEFDGETGTYACLSHCWGEDPMPIKTMIDTLDEHRRFISWSALPKTFQDAVVIARALGLRYLWIDTLCIIQDSAPDWQTESSKMADIYQNSLLTIAATSSPDFRGGCFAADQTSDICLKIEGVEGGEALIAARDCHGESLMMERESFRKLFPLYSRGWVFQERMLSRRVLYCTHSELQFECRERLVCECDNNHMYPFGPTKTIEGRRMQQSKNQYAEPMRKHGVRGQYSTRELCQSWQSTVAQYSDLLLTRATDKLPALSGCAKALGTLTGDTYLAGIWRATFAEGMLWTVIPPIDLSRPEKWRSPSWSWASVDTTAGIKYTYALKSVGRHDFQDSIEAVECAPANEDVPTLEVKSGYVRIKASLCTAYLRRICRRCQTSRSRAKYTLEHDTWYQSGRHGGQGCVFRVPRLDLNGCRMELHPDFKYDEKKDFDFADADAPGGCKVAPISLLHLYDHQSLNSDVVSDFFLILKTASVQTPQGAFERAGMVTLSFDNWTQRDAWFTGIFMKDALERPSILIV